MHYISVDIIDIFHCSATLSIELFENVEKGDFEIGLVFLSSLFRQQICGWTSMKYWERVCLGTLNNRILGLIQLKSAFCPLCGFDLHKHS